MDSFDSLVGCMRGSQYMSLSRLDKSGYLKMYKRIVLT